jgi:hypothetical protein
MRALCVLVSAITLCACATQGAQQPPTATSAQASVTLEDAKVALMNARHYWKDPDSIKDTRVGQPYTESCRGHVQHWVQQIDACICIATNAKNSFGAYAGATAQVALLVGRGRAVLDMVPARSQDQCAAMTPWPEFDGRATR